MFNIGYLLRQPVYILMNQLDKKLALRSFHRLDRQTLHRPNFDFELFAGQNIGRRRRVDERFSPLIGLKAAE